MLRSRNEKNIMTYVPSNDLNLYNEYNDFALKQTLVPNVHITFEVTVKLQ